MDVRLVLVNTAVLLTALAAAHGSQLYPKIVRLERTDGETFVSQPNVLSGVRNITVTRSQYPRTKGNKLLYRYDSMPHGALNCSEPSYRDNTVTSRNSEMRRDLPGTFVCGNKSIHVMPVIEVESGRIFNVSLDFVKVQNPAGLSVWSNPMDRTYAVFQLAPSGIVFVSGLFPQQQIGSLTFRVNIMESNRTYQLYVLIVSSHGEHEPSGPVATFKMTSDQDHRDLVGNIKLQIEAVKCAARAFRVDPMRLYGVAFQEKSANEFNLQARSDDGWCIQPTNASRPAVNEPCNSFTIKDKVAFDPNRTRCDEIETMRQHSTIVERNEQIEHVSDIVSDVELDEDNKIISPNSVLSDSGPEIAVALASATPTSVEAQTWTTASVAVEPDKGGTPVTREGSFSFSSDLNSQPTENTADKPILTSLSSKASESTSAVHSSTASEPTSAVRSSTTSGPTAASRGKVPVTPSTAPSTPTPTETPSSSDASVSNLVANLQNSNQKAEAEQSGAKLKSAVYGMTGLACLVVIVLFVFLFKKVAVCKSKAGYDPVFVARHSNAT